MGWVGSWLNPNEDLWDPSECLQVLQRATQLAEGQDTQGELLQPDVAARWFADAVTDREVELAREPEPKFEIMFACLFVICKNWMIAECGLSLCPH